MNKIDILHQRTSQRQHSGFTIVELLVVIAVVGILATIGLVSYNGYIQRANKSSADATVSQIKLKLGEYYTDNNRYPANATDLNTYLNAVNASALVTDFAKIRTGGGTYTTSPGGCVTTSGTACTTYTITVPASYWKGGSSESPITVTP